MTVKEQFGRDSLQDMVYVRVREKREHLDGLKHGV